MGAGPLALPGVLTVPDAPGPHPGVVILGGSGPTDRDGTVGSVKPLRDLAHGLAPLGIAFLRFDKRPKAHPAELLSRPNQTLRDEYIDDALVALDLLRRRPEVDPSRVFLLGNSLGVVVAPRVALEAPWLAGLVLMAAGLETPGDAIVRQTEYLARLDGLVTPGEQLRIDEARRNAEAIQTLATGGEVTGPSPYGLPRSYWVDIYTYDPIATMRCASRPVLLMQGGRDYQVRPEDLARWEEGLSGLPDVTAERYPAADHMFTEGGLRVAEAVVADIGSWVMLR